MKIKMDNIGETYKAYKNINRITSAVMLVLIQVYIVCLTLGYDPLSFSYIDNHGWRVVASTAFDLFVIGSIFSIVYFVVSYIYKFFWVRNHKAMWLRGEWLHIHIKANNVVRVGVVEIKQNYHDIKASSQNYFAGNKQPTKYTKWEYFSARLLGDVDNMPDLMGCYKAEKKGGISGDINYGIHLMDINRSYNRHDYPYLLEGRFSDTLKTENNHISDINPTDHTGEIRFYRMTKVLKTYLYKHGSLDEKKLTTIYNTDNEQLREEKFVSDYIDAVTSTGLIK